MPFSKQIQPEHGNSLHGVPPILSVFTPLQAPGRTSVQVLLCKRRQLSVHLLVSFQRPNWRGSGELQRSTLNVFCLNYLCNFERSQASQFHCRMKQLHWELQFSLEDSLSCCPDLCRHRTNRNLSSWSRHKHLNVMEVTVLLGLIFYLTDILEQSIGVLLPLRRSCEDGTKGI